MSTEYMIEKAELPPPQRRGRKPGIWIERLKPLMSDSGQWYIVARGKYDNITRKASLLKKKDKDGVDNVLKPEGEWEFATRVEDKDSDEKVGLLYARYLGVPKP
jgi:hypothetical protein